MKTSVFIFLFILISCKKESEIFEFTTESSNKSLVEELKQIKNRKPYGFLLEDENYEIWKSCSGEWGGSVYFKNKKTGKLFATKSSCAVSVNKINNKYYISNSLEHLFGNCNITEISNPEHLKSILKLPSFHPEISTREYETDNSSGTKNLVDSSGILIRTSFVYQNKLYSILTDNQGKKNTISEVIDSKFKTLAELPDNIFYNEPIIIQDKNNSQKLYFQSPKAGILEINNNQIKITYYKK
jgi:hypothetical protein